MKVRGDVRVRAQHVRGGVVDIGDVNVDTMKRLVVLQTKESSLLLASM